ncbi:POU domain, class 6, transcription factor 1 isoform X2 [Anser cygnoides]|uniref:POU domain, class 6, transcription factor 1 isoform X2 n=1 Tax=Anser cygnoides TaxID=8845 RepID=UPI0034D30FF8
MDPEAVQTQEAPLTVNEQVIVMSSHETIRVLEVGVDAPPPAEEDRKPLEMPPGEGARGSPRGSGDPGREDVPPSAETSCSAEAAGKTKPAAGATPSSVPPGGTFGHAASQQPQPLAPLAAPQVLTQENLATVVTGVMVPAGTVTQPLLIPISIAGQVAGQQGLAVWTFPTATVAALPGLTAASPTGGIFKPPIANLQDQRRLPGGANAAPQLPGSCPRDRQHHLQRAGHHGADPDQRPGPGDRDPAVGGEPPRHRGGQPGAGPKPAGAGGDAPAAAQCPGPGDRHAGQRHHPSGHHQEKRPPRAPHQERGAAHPAGPSSAPAGRGHRQPCAGSEGGLGPRPHHLLRDAHRQPAGGQAPGPQQRRGGGRHQPGGDPGVRQELQDPAPVPRPDADPGGAGPDGHRGPCLQPVGHLQVREARHHPQERPEAEAGAGEVAERGRAAQPGGAAEPDGVRGRRALQEAQAPDVLHAAGHRGAQRLLREERAAHRPGDHRDRQGAQLRPRSRPRVVLQPPTDAQKHQQTQRLSDPLRKGAGGAPHAQTPSLTPPPRPSLLPSALCDRLSLAPAPLPGSGGGLGSPPNRARRCPCPPPAPHVAQLCSHPVSRVPRRPVTCVVPDPRLHSPCLPTPPG